MNRVLLAALFTAALTAVPGDERPDVGRDELRLPPGAACRLVISGGDVADGEHMFLAGHLQISPEMLAHPRRPVCKACLDWSERRHHLAGTLGAALMRRFTELKWAARDAAPGSRVVNFSRNGEKRFAALFGESP